MPEDRRADVSKWPRERVAAAIAYARSWGAVPSTPMHHDPNQWLTDDANVVHAADEILRAIAKERLTRGDQAVQSAQEQHELGTTKQRNTARPPRTAAGEALFDGANPPEAAGAEADEPAPSAHGMHG